MSSDSVVTFASNPKMLSGSDVIAVDSKCRLDNDVRLAKDVGNDPAIGNTSADSFRTLGRK